MRRFIFIVALLVSVLVGKSARAQIPVPNTERIGIFDVQLDHDLLDRLYHENGSNMMSLLSALQGARDEATGRFNYAVELLCERDRQYCSSVFQEYGITINTKK